MSDKGGVRGALAVVVLLILGWPFIGFRQVEDDLTAGARELAAPADLPGAEVEFNGRDGYLLVPAGSDQAAARQLASDIADLRGVRDVEIIEDSDGTATDGGASDRDNPETETETGDDTGTGDDDRDGGRAGAGDDGGGDESDGAEPAEFEVSWDADGADQTGSAPEDVADALAALGLDSPTTDDVTVTDDVRRALDALAELVPRTVIDGTLTVTDGDALAITGTAAGDDALDEATDALADLPAVDLDLEAADAAAESVESDEATDAQDAIDEALTFDSIEFVYNTATPTPDTVDLIGDIAGILADHPDVAVHIVGHTDSLGDDARNQALSEERARAVLDGLTAAGVDEGRLSAEGRGEADPIDTNDTPEGQQRNRRVDLTVKEIG